MAPDNGDIGSFNLCSPAATAKDPMLDVDTYGNTPLHPTRLIMPMENLINSRSHLIYLRKLRRIANGKGTFALAVAPTGRSCGRDSPRGDPRTRQVTVSARIVVRRRTDAFA